MNLPREHALREPLNREIHARPPESLAAPLSIAYLVLLSSGNRASEERDHVGHLVSAHDLEPPLPGESHYSVALPDFQLKVEWHTEFTRYMVIGPGADPGKPPDAVLELLPEGWVAGLPGELIFAALCGVFPGASERDELALAGQRFGASYVGASISDGAATAYTDFELRADRFNHFLVFDHGTTEQQLGRIVQRLLEINTYWILALLALPVAREVGPQLAEQEGQLQRVSLALASRAAADDDSVLLRALTDLEADVSSHAAQHAYRFSASRAYYALVTRRVRDLRERRLPGLQTYAEFTERRLAPAMATCQSVESRQANLLEAAGRATRLLATRVSVNQELQNQTLLESMNRRTEMQLRLQQTVEGLSVAAITYYVVGLVSYLVSGAHGVALPVDGDVITAVSVPLVLGLVAWGLRRARRRLTGEEGA